MGSSGYGAFGNYKQEGNEDLCFNEIKDVALEDVSRQEYLQNKGRLPVLMEEVCVMDSLHNKRIAVKSVHENLLIGYLPTTYSYLLSCMKKGIRYFGQVNYSTESPIPIVKVTLNAED
ncbi:hypothetical protein J27TS8_27270 [Robertmurraya siralis]|uniref:Uncharacterized protein n=1 Tax=Robertmurraya siralis TaxID=77777 RepID=A0A920BU95_9BACI|nr:hypothetical protein [Robertmurraya siralis]GIN62734.1 hypothetical protein J27TS8_27270 [Robertmurraya siralis]